MRRVKMRMLQGQLRASQPMLVPPGDSLSASELGLTAVQRAKALARLAGGGSGAASVASLHVQCAYAEFRASSFSTPPAGGGGSALSRGGGSGSSPTAAVGSAPSAGMYPLMDDIPPWRLATARLPPAAPKPRTAVLPQPADLRDAADAVWDFHHPAGGWDCHITPRAASLTQQASERRAQGDGNSDGNNRRRRKSVSFMEDRAPTPLAWPRSHGL